MSDGSHKLRAPSKATFHFLAGLSSGTVSAVLLQPIDFLKTRVQQSGHHSLRRTISDVRSSPRGLLSLYRGTVPSALRTGFGSAIYFSTLNSIRSYVSRTTLLSSSQNAALLSRSSHSSNLPRLSGYANLLTGGAARAFAGFVLMPLTILKVRYESSLYNYGSLGHAARDILRREGARGFFAGFGATAMRDAPYAGLYVLFYEECKKTLGSAFPEQQQTMGVSRAATINFTSGVLAATTCSAVSNPFDAIKTRIQLQPGVYRNMWHAVSKMLREEGPRALFDGLALRMSRKAVSSALAWTVYEELIRRAEGAVVAEQTAVA